MSHNVKREEGRRSSRGRLNARKKQASSEDIEGGIQSKKEKTIIQSKRSKSFDSDEMASTGKKKSKLKKTKKEPKQSCQNSVGYYSSDESSSELSQDQNQIKQNVSQDSVDSGDVAFSLSEGGDHRSKTMEKDQGSLSTGGGFFSSDDSADDQSSNMERRKKLEKKYRKTTGPRSEAEIPGSGINKESYLEGVRKRLTVATTPSEGACDDLEYPERKGHTPRNEEPESFVLGSGDLLKPKYGDILNSDEAISSTTQELVMGKKETAGFQDEKHGNSFCWTVLQCGIVLLALLALSAIVIVIIPLVGNQKDEETHSRFVHFIKNMRSLRAQFPSQTERLWDIIGGACQSHIKDPPYLVSPVVLLLAGTSDAAITMGCLATNLAFMFDDILQSSHSHVIIDGSKFQGEDVNESKMKIKDKLSSGFNSSAKSAIIHNLDDLPPCSVFVFHSFCDNEFAPYKDAAIIHTVQLEGKQADLKDHPPKKFDKIVGDHLRKKWDLCDDLQPDKQDAMLSRLANNVAMVTAEKDMESIGSCS